MSSTKNLEYEKTAFLSKSNSTFIEEMYVRFVNNDPALPDSWRKYFDEIVARLDKRGHEGLDVFLHEVCNVTEYNTALINPVSSS